MDRSFSGRLIPERQGGDSGPLLARAPMGPFIHAGQENHHAKPVTGYAPRGCYCLWLLPSGQVDCVIGTDRQRLQAPVAILQTPKAAPRLDIPAGSGWLRLLFDVTWRPLRYRGKGRARVAVDPDSVQADPQAIWGVDLPWRVPKTVYDSCFHMLRDCLTWWWRSDLAWLRANHRLGTWLTDFVAEVEAHDEPARSPAVEESWLVRAVESIQQGLEQHLDVAYLAAQAGMSESTFRRRFQAGTGLSPRAFLARERMRRAGYLLAETDKGQREVARLCGFASASTFSRRFRAWAGTNPTDWRRRQRGERQGRGRVPWTADASGHNDLPWS